MNRHVPADELIMGLTEKECRSALLMLAYASTSLTAEDDDDAGLNATQAAIAEDVTQAAVRQVLTQTRDLPAAAARDDEPGTA